MRRDRWLSPRRRGFTLIELLVVIAIIAVLIGMTAAAVFKVFSRGDEVKVTSDLTQLKQAIADFKAAFKGVGDTPPPSRIVLRENSAYDPNNALEMDSLNYLQKMFPALTFPPPSGTFYDWNGNGVADANPVTLTGDQCLVFFLGGIPDRSGTATTGFSKNIRNPTAAGGERIGPFFQFPANRLRRGANGFFSFIDGYGQQPYAYFSNYGRDNGYNRYGNSDCANLGVSPYLRSNNPTNVYWEPKSFQIICAGKDGQFGPGGLYTAGSASGVGRDDRASFHDKILGAQ